MNEQFSVNEVATLQNLTGVDAHLNGQDALVVGGLLRRSGEDVNGKWFLGFWSYVVEIPGEEGDWCVTPEHLKKKHPPATDTGEMRIKEMFTKSPVVAPVDQPIPELA